MSKQRRYTNEQLIEAVRSSGSVRQVLSKLGLAEAGGNYSHIRQLINELKIDDSHFHGQGWRKGRSNYSQSLSEIMVCNSSYKSLPLKKRLFEEGIKKQQCESCGITEWLCQPISLELHHINNIRNDHRLNNLKVLCPNCHSQTPHFRNRK